MYTIASIIFLGLSIGLIVNGIRRRKKGRVVVGIMLAVVASILLGLFDFWGEMLWFEAMGYSRRFWEAVWIKVSAGVIGAVFGLVFVYLLTLGLEQENREKQMVRTGAAILGGIVGGFQGSVNWEVILKFFNQVPSQLKDPIYGKPVSFYLFHLPFYDVVYHFLLALSVIALGTSVISGFVTIQPGGNIGLRSSSERKNLDVIFRCSGVLMLVVALGRYLDRFHLMYSELGVLTGPGWTDVHVRIPALAIVVVLLVIAGIVLILPPLRSLLQRKFKHSQENTPRALSFLGAVMLIIAVTWIFGLGIVPGLFQWLRVEPNEITFEKPYIKHNIKFTRHGFNLAQVKEHEFPAAEKFEPQMVRKNPQIFDNIRLWDWRALDAVYKQFQEIRLYYEFYDVDVDRYAVGDQYLQVMVSAREMESDNLPEQSQTFVNRRFKYTHGYGITLTSVTEFTPQGLPDLMVKDIPPVSRFPQLEVEQPRIYYGELSNHPVVVNTHEKEFDYPKGEENVYIHYPGSGGVPFKNLWWRKFLFGWKFEDLRLFLSSYPTSKSRILFHRQIEDRVQSLAPFLEFDEDPYIVLADKKLCWIIDGYTTTSYYPYSEPFSGIEEKLYSERKLRGIPNPVQRRFIGANYVRNSVKAVVDAFNGTVTFYIFDEKDPIILTWRNIFPELFRSREDMPKALADHVRYPKDMLLIQGLVYAKYHMSDPTVFYNQEDLWVRATEKYYNQVQPVEPYYIMWEFPGSDEPEFVLMLPFTPKNRQVLIGWIAGMCDGDNYGKFLAYKFPKEKRVLGPQQVETKIDQDSYLSGQLTLWDQRGSRVIRGNVLAIPIEETLLYVEPIYLQAETAAYPELRLVALMHNDNLSYAESFDKALEGLFGGRTRTTVEKDKTKPLKTEFSISEGIRRANDAFEKYLRFIGEKQFSRAAAELERLQSALKNLSQRAGKQK